MTTLIAYVYIAAVIAVCADRAERRQRAAAERAEAAAEIAWWQAIKQQVKEAK